MTLTKPSRTLAACAAAASLAAGVSACGGSGNDKAKVQERVRTLYDGFAKKDAGRICGSLSSKQKERITQSTAKSGKKQTCEQVMSFALAFLGNQLKDAGKANVTDVKVDGDNAQATVDFKGKKGRLGLSKQGSDWLVSDFNLKKL